MTQQPREFSPDPVLVQKLLDAFYRPVSTNIGDVLIYSMQYAAKFREYSGSEKKEMVIASIVAFVDEADVLQGGVERAFLQSIPGMIDLLVAVDNNKLVINPKTKGVVKKAHAFLKSLCCTK